MTPSTSIEQLESLALADDRASVIDSLVAGSEEQLYWRAIDAQHRGDLAAVDAILASWPSDGRPDPRKKAPYKRVHRRQQLLKASADLATHAPALIRELGVSYDHHAPEAEAAAAQHPNALDQALLDEEALVNAAVQRGHYAFDDDLTPWGLRLVDPRALDAPRRLAYLRRAGYEPPAAAASLPHLVEAIAAELGEKSSAGFGALDVHRHLTADALDALVGLRPELRDHPIRVELAVARLRPAAHVDVEGDGAARAAYLDAVLRLLEPLPPAFAPHRSLALFHRLACDVRAGAVERARVLAYLALPRPAGGASVNPQVEQRKQHAAAGGAGGAGAGPVPSAPPPAFVDALGLGAPQDDLRVLGPCVRTLLGAEGAEGEAVGAELGALVDERWLARTRAEVKLLGGATDGGWADVLGAAAAACLRERVDLELLPANPSRFGRSGPVSLRVALKNVPSLRVRVFRVHVPAWFDAHAAAPGAQLDAAMDLDGLAAGAERVLTYAHPPMLRHEIAISLPECEAPGTYVVELLGGRRASRALVRRGDLRCAARPSAAGLSVAVLDECGAPCARASLTLGGAGGGKTYGAGADGSITLPFSTRPGRVPVLLTDGELAVVSAVHLRPERYELRASWLVERQSLLGAERASALLRLGLSIDGAAASVSLLEEAHVEVTTTDGREVTAKRREPLAPSDDAESVVELRLPADARAVRLKVGARVRVLSEQRTAELSAEEEVALATMHAAPATAALYLRHVPGSGYRLALLGKSGEPVPRRALTVRLRSRALHRADAVEATLSTDAAGEVRLGALAGVVGLSARAGELVQTFELGAPPPLAPREQVVFEQAVEGAPEPICVPLAPAALAAEEAGAGAAAGAARARQWAAVEVRAGGVPVRDVSAHVRAQGGALRATGLRAGRYVFWAAGGGPDGGGVSAEVTVAPRPAEAAAGEAADAPRVWASLPSALLELSTPQPTALAELRPSADGGLRLALSGCGPSTRVHVLGAPFAPSPLGEGQLACADVCEPVRCDGALGAATYLSGRQLGDEYCYVLDRQQKRPRRAGVLLDRPSLLVHPTARRETSTRTQHAREGSAAYACNDAGLGGCANAAPFGSGGGGGGGGGGEMRARRKLKACGRARDARAGARAEPRAEGPEFPSYDFLPVAPARAVLLHNLRPGPDGVLELRGAELRGAAHAHIVVVDPSATFACRAVLSPPQHAAVGAEPAAVRDLRQPAAPSGAPARLRETRRLVGAPAGTALDLADRSTARLELVDSVAKLHRALSALAPAHVCADLGALELVTRWHALGEAQKRAAWSEHACHELALFVWSKDRPFFDAAVRPGLRAKARPGLLDLCLLGAPPEQLRAHLAPRRLARCNALELALLARSLPADDPAPRALHRRLAEQLELRPADPALDERAVDTVIAGGDAAGDALAPALAECRDEFGAEAMAGAMCADVLEACEEAREEADDDDDFEPRARSCCAMAAAAPPPPPPPGAAPRAARGLAQRREQQQQQQQLYRAADRTREWAETTWRRRDEADAAGPELVPPARLWAALAAHSPSDGPFLCAHFADAACSFSAAMGALAVLELPFAPPPGGAAEVDAVGAGVHVHLRSHAIAALVETVPVRAQPTRAVLLGHSLVRADDRWAWEGSERVEKEAGPELLVRVVYACRLVVSNPASRRLRVAVLHRVPAGAVPVCGSIHTRTSLRELPPFGSATLEYSFYFPSAGVFAHPGATVTLAAGGADAPLLAAAEPAELRVVEAPSAVDSDSWSAVARSARLDELLAYLGARSLARVELSELAWRCRERGAFGAITAALAARHAFEPTLWSYALLHADRARAAEWLDALGGAALGDLGPAFECALLTLEPAERGEYEHLEYGPLVNARAHALGGSAASLNDGLAAQWRAFCARAAHRPAPLRPADALCACHYLFAMDRADEAVALLATLDAPGGGAAAVALPPVPCAPQLQYMRAYAAVVTGDLARARAHVSGLPAALPLDRWRARFAALAALLDEAEGGGGGGGGGGSGGAGGAADADSREAALAAAAARTPTISVRVEGESVVLDHAGPTRAATLGFWKLDLELFFSQQPFFGEGERRFTLVEPTRVHEVALDPGAHSTRVDIPDELRRASIVIEASAGPGARHTCTHFAHEIAISLTPAYGRLQVRHARTGAALPAAYVKCYARYRDGGAVRFFKDGYTDLCGTFDYATLSTDELERVQRFALLVAHDDAGATVVEAAPPAR